MKRWKRIGLISFGVMAILFLTSVILPALAVEEGTSTGIVTDETVIASGDVNETVTWKITEDDRGERTLIIAGTGPMDDYKSQSEQPWAAWKDKSFALVVEDGVTRIGNYSMYGLIIREIHFGKDVEVLGDHSFAYGSGLTSITIPGTVKRIESDAFVYHYSISSVTLEEGVEELAQSAFGVQTGTSLVAHIPASMKKIANLPFWTASAYTVDEENPYFTAIDGVLYSKDGTELVDYPKLRETMEYRIPDTVCTIHEGALQRVVSTKKIYIPSSVQKMQSQFLFRWSGFEEVYVDDGVPLSGELTFYSCNKLTKVRLPENIEIRTLTQTFAYGCNCLESLKIPNGVAIIDSIGSPTKALTSIEYDASNAVIKDKQVLDGDISYELTIGESVDYLPKEFTRFSAQAETIRFQGANQLTVETGAFEGLDNPLESLEGTVYVDEQGVLYLYDEEEGTARIVYCQSGFEDIFIPEQIQPEEGVICNVTSVGQDAFKEASGVRTVTFEKPEQIEQIAPYAFANCETLGKVNEYSTVETVKALFTAGQTEIGYRAFYNTALIDEDVSSGSSDDMDGYGDLAVSGDGMTDLKITVKSEGDTMSWQDAGQENETGEYSLLTGDTLTVYAATGNREGEEDYRYRIYFQWTDSDCSLSVKKGETYTFDDQTAVCYGTEDPNSLYLEFVPLIGKTLSIPVAAVYPSPLSDGGSLCIWAVILDETEALETEGELVYSATGAIRARWGTERDSFSLTKTSTGTTALTLKGTEDGRVIPGANLEWKIILQRASENTSSYGKDYVRNVTYQDSLTLPDGIYWKEEVIEAVRDGEVRKSGNFVYAGEHRVVNLYLSGGQLNLSGVSLKWNDELDTVMITWKVTNTVKTAQMNTNTLSCIVYADALEADVEEFSESKDNVISNTVEAWVGYYHSGREELSSTAEKTIKIAPGSLSFTSKTVVSPYYFGEPVQYLITLNNPGALPYTTNVDGSWSVKDTLSPYTYITAEGMETMFAEDHGKNLTITITNAELAEWEEEQGIYEGTTFWKNSFNSGENLKENAQSQLIIGWNSSGTGIQVEADGLIYEEASLEESLKAAGYACGRWDEYTVVWQLNSAEECFKLNAGEVRQFSVYATVKDTFQMLSKDWETSYPTDVTLTLTNTASLSDAESQIRKNASLSATAKRESRIAKYASLNGQILQDGFTIEDGEFLTYTLEFIHYGKGSYTNLPIVDDLYGAQVLLVEKDKNPELAEQGLEILVRDEKEFFVLTEGTYFDVKLGGSNSRQDYIAADITVEAAEDVCVETGEESHTYTGLHTHIEWKCPELPSGNYKMYLTYESQVRQQLSGGNVYTVGNVVWMNDKINSRIYASLWGGGTIIDFCKEIVDSKGASWKEDSLDEDGYSLLSVGEEVTYRMTLRSKGKGVYTVNGLDLADELPFNGSVFAWTKGTNVRLTYESSHESTQITGLDQWTIEDSWDGDTEDGQQYILWPEDAQIVFAEADARVYIYVTLIYPEQEGMIWSSYCNAVNGDILVNTFYVYDFPVNVTHHLGEPGQVLLQKGVYGTSYGSERSYVEIQSRNYYNNKDSRDRQVIYYLVLYNGGTKRWYLNDVYDKLPEGYSFTRLINDGNLNKSADTIYVTTLSDFEQNNLIEAAQNSALPEDVVYKNALIRQQDVDDTTIRFQISAGEGNQPVSYDEERQQYYLSQNEAIVFGYMCDVGLTEETEDLAQNTAVMHYTDYPKTGVEIVDEDWVSFSGVITEIHGDQNDGNCSMMLGADIMEQFGIQEGTVDDTWLVSDVTVGRGQIIPGLTKYTESYVSTGSGLETEYSNAVGPYDQINWRVRLHNSGTLSITDYTFEDILPAPYVFCGTVKYTIYDYMGQAMQSFDLLTFSDRTEDGVIIENNNSKITVSPDGESVTIKISNQGTGFLSIGQTEDGEEILIIQFSDYTASIPEGGYVDLTFSSYNPTNHFKNTVYTNQAVLKPNVQEFSAVSQGSMVRGTDGTPIGVKNSSPVTVSFGYATSSEKLVQDKTDDENKAVSTQKENNYIVLSSEEKEFSYHLTVTNDTDKAMEKLVLIDSLPEPGDSSPFNGQVARNSEFKVSLTEASNPNVKITLEDGTSYELEEDEYTVGYSEQSVFFEEDWNGSSVWNGEKELARALRIVIDDDTGERIPARAAIEVSFDCFIDDETEPGEMAWNSFGYHYKLNDLEQELEAMPLVVGVKVPEVPVLEKKLVDLNGNALQAEKDTRFIFLIYEGQARDSSFSSLEEYVQELEENQLAYTIQEVGVGEGESSSEPVVLKDFTWEEGKTYTITEFIDDSCYEIRSMNGLYKDTYSFEYSKDGTMTITCVNTYLEWNLDLRKTDAQDDKCYLSGAVFALYSPKETDAMEDTAQYEVYEVDRILEHNDRQWYLMDIQATDEEGKISWTHLQEEQYLLAELEAPDGYNLSGEYHIVYRRNAVSGVVQEIIENEKGAVLPLTGGNGMAFLVVTGLVTAFLGYILSWHRKRYPNLME